MVVPVMRLLLTNLSALFQHKVVSLLKNWSRLPGFVNKSYTQLLSTTMANYDAVALYVQLAIFQAVRL